MPAFQYVARNTQGKTMTGVVEAPTQSQVVKQLREQGMIPTSITEGGSAATAKAKISGKTGRVRLDDLVIMSRQFSTMIRAGMPLIEVLDVLSEQAEKVTLKQILKQVEGDVEAGSSLTEALGKHPRVFGTFYVSMVKAGEAAGMLESILDQIATYLEKIASLQRKIKSAIIYPATVAVVAFGITVFLLTVVVPVFEDIFRQLKGDLPLPTKITMGISAFIRDHYLIASAIVVAIVVVAWQWGKTKSGRYQLDKLKLRMPIFGPLFLKVSIAKFSRTLSTLIRSGVNILSALEIVAATAGNVVVEEAVFKTKASIQSGESLSQPLTESGVFPPMVTRMIAVGERTGALENMLSKIGEFYEDQVDAAVAGLTSLIEPLLIVFLGVVIGFIVISMFMPLFKMIQYIE